MTIIEIMTTDSCIEQLTVNLSKKQMEFVRSKGGSQYIQTLIEEQMRKTHHRPEPTHTSKLVDKLKKMSATSLS